MFSYTRVFLVLTSVLTISVSISLDRQNVSNKLGLSLQNTLTEKNTANIFISFVQGTSSVLQAISETRFPTRDDLLIALHNALNLHAEFSQYQVTRFLNTHPEFNYTSLWITNQVHVHNATLELVNSLLEFEEVSEILEEENVLLEDPISAGPIIKKENTLAEWGIKKIQAEEALSLLNNATTNAASIRVATLDTGVRGTHEALKDNYLGSYGWFDPYERTDEPNDYNGHGTHVMGTICGKGGIGVFPDASWIACKGCLTASCSQLALLMCGQWVTCPTLSDGQEDCTKAPHLVSNSWGGGSNNNWFDSVIGAWHAAKIIPVFGVGNAGPDCGTVVSPGDRNVIGVGSTTAEDTISGFSGVGPTKGGQMKPEVSAPGSNILSAYNTADDDYRELSGTSMACPHASGLIALLLAFDEELKYNQLLPFVFDGAETEPLQSSGNECNGIPDTSFPNHFFGHGRINAFRSLTKVIESST